MITKTIGEDTELTVYHVGEDTAEVGLVFDFKVEGTEDTKKFDHK